MTISDNIQRVRERMAAACAHSQRNLNDVTLIAVSKTHPVESVLEAAEVGVQHFGENRVEEAESKIPAANAKSTGSLQWHMIGHLQSRKIKDALALFNKIDSVDSLRLAEKLSRAAVERGLTLEILLEINVSGEESKYGFQATGWRTNPAVREPLFDALRQVAGLPGLQVRGLMTMAPIVDDMEQTRPIFADLAALRAEAEASLGLRLPDLSMGMTDDYPIAIEEGATLIRVGRAIFGERAHDI
ncbi:MAG: YggS family pyridoxal phosphate-dependent enzyme [Anaerolineae bacterium]|nr:YggS family pyridoxal phosphate-dependent enzyme [Anaerolineae bacterium]